MKSIVEIQDRLEEISAELAWERRLARSGLPHDADQVFWLMIEAGDLEQREELWIISATTAGLLCT